MRSRRRPAQLCAGMLAVALVAGCGPWRGRLERPPAPPLEKITVIETRVPRPGELPAVVGRLQRHRVRPRETLLDVARDAGLGFSAVHDANPGVDEWVPPPDAEVVVPSRWIIPRSRYRGLIVNIPEMRLYMFPADAHPGERVPMLTWAVGIGAEEAPSPVGPFTVRAKDKNPTWIVPASILRTRETPERVVPPGPENPLGAYRIRLSKGLYSIHGTNDPWSIGRLTTHGCIRLYPEDIEVLYPLVDRGAPGELVYQPVKIGEDAGRIYVEVHDDVYRRIRDLERHALAEVKKAGLAGRVDAELLRAAVRQKRGIPVDVTRQSGRPRVPRSPGPPPRAQARTRRLSRQ
jgi:L,D-transpeptidase ErfK/SrfK